MFTVYGFNVRATRVYNLPGRSGGVYTVTPVSGGVSAVYRIATTPRASTATLLGGSGGAAYRAAAYAARTVGGLS